MLWPDPREQARAQLDATYFFNNFGFTGRTARPRAWARCYNLGIPAHQIFLERNLA